MAFGVTIIPMIKHESVILLAQRRPDAVIQGIREADDWDFDYTTNKEVVLSDVRKVSSQPRNSSLLLRHVFKVVWLVHTPINRQAAVLLAASGTFPFEVSWI